MGYTEAEASQVFDYFFSNGYVIKTPHSLLVGGNDPSDQYQQSWFVAWAEVHPDYKAANPLFSSIRHFLSLMPYYRPFIRFGRGLKNIETRTYRTESVLRFAPSLNTHTNGLQVSKDNSPISSGSVG